jgi:hypothetical protein
MAGTGLTFSRQRFFTDTMNASAARPNWLAGWLCCGCPSATGMLSKVIIVAGSISEISLAIFSQIQ